MTFYEQFMAYLADLESRLRWKSLVRGLLVLGAGALLATIALSWIADKFAFSSQAVFWSRVALFFAVAFCLAFGLVLPRLRLTRKSVALAAEKRFPHFSQRVITLAGTDQENPFLELLAEEAVRGSENAQPGQMVSGGLLAAFAATAACAFCVLGWLIFAAPGALGYGASVLWTNGPRKGMGPLYAITVTPGDAKVRRGGDQLVEARLSGFDSSVVSVRVRQKGVSKWETLRMEPSLVGNAWGFLFAGLSSSVEYSIESGPVKSQVYTLTVVDLPSVQRIKVTYRFPGWTGLREVSEESGGDLRAVEGTEAELLIKTDRPMGEGTLILDDGKRVPLEKRGPDLAAVQLKIEKDGSYHIAARDGSDEVRISEDYFIEAKKETAPDVRIARPGRDLKASPIEEVPVVVEASDDFGLQQVELRYSVNGQPEKAVQIGRSGGREAKGSALLALEDYKLVPGDIVAVYATARDARATARTDMFFIEAQPFEREYSQSQVMGGGEGGGGGEREGEISQRQKEIIAATWNELRGLKPPAQMKEDAQFLSGVQQKLSEQAKSLSQRMRSRELAGTNEEFRRFSTEMDEAAKAMTEASGKLKEQKWRDALAPEQKALQHLLRAEATFRQIQVAFGQRGGGGGGGGQGMRDLESLFDLELDTEKNQYETAQSGGSSGQREQQVDEALKRLEELARRQQELANQQQQSQQKSFQQKWAQEMLRREAEELRRQMQQLSRGETGSPDSSQQQASSSQQGSSGQSSSSSRSQGQQQSGQQSASSRLGQMAGRQPADPRLERALKSVERAIEDMRKSAQSGPQQGSDAASAQRAAERMAEARDQVAGLRRQETGQAVDELARRADRLAEQQRDFERRLGQAFPSAQSGQPAPRPQPGTAAGASERLAAEKEGMQKEYERLEENIRQTMRALGSKEREAASRLREALGEAQQTELRLRLKYGAEWIRRGMGGYLGVRERVVTEALDRLSDQIRKAQDSLGSSGAQGKENVARALDQLERLRSQLDRNASGQETGQQGEQQSGGRSGQQSAQSGQSGQQQSGEKAGQQGQPGQQGQEGPRGQRGQQGQQGGQQQGGTSQDRGYDQSNRRGWAGYSAMNDGTRRFDQGVYNDTVRELNRLRSSGEAGEETSRDVQELIREMERLDPKRFPGNPELLERMRASLLPRLEQLELRLRRDLENGSGQSVRQPSTTRPPAGYADAAAEYYRRLSRIK